jgi:probable rRNA maturation factor
MIRPVSAPPVIARPSLSLQVQIASAAHRPDVERRQLRRWILATLEQSAVLTLRFVDRDEARQLNREFRDRDYATNVLTFIYDAEPPIRPNTAAPVVQADIVLCLDVLADEARAQHKPFRDHLAHLVIHGALHAQGWDHESNEAATQMEAREIQLLKRFRIANPYQIPKGPAIGIPGKLRYPHPAITT